MQRLPDMTICCMGKSVDTNIRGAEETFPFCQSQEMNAVMMKILGTIPKTHFHLACSGGSDSMALLDFLLKYPRNRFDILHFNHGTKWCGEAEEFVVDFCNRHGLECHVGRISGSKSDRESWEEYWRNQRYAFFKGFSDERILMAHHLNDCIETWTMTALVGNPHLIPYFNPRFNVARPWLMNPKRAINEWIAKHNVEHVFDESNNDISIKRNYVRKMMLEHIYHVNPGIEKTIQKKILENYKSSLYNVS